MLNFLKNSLDFFLLKPKTLEDLKFSAWTAGLSVVFTGALYGWINFNPDNKVLVMNILINAIYSWFSFVILFQFMQWWLKQKQVPSTCGLAKVLASSIFVINFIPFYLQLLNGSIAILSLVLTMSYSIYLVSFHVNKIYNVNNLKYLLTGSLIVSFLQMTLAFLFLSLEARIWGAPGIAV